MGSSEKRATSKNTTTNSEPEIRSSPEMQFLINKINKDNAQLHKLLEDQKEETLQRLEALEMKDISIPRTQNVSEVAQGDNNQPKVNENPQGHYDDQTTIEIIWIGWLAILVSMLLMDFVDIVLLLYRQTSSV